MEKMRLTPQQFRETFEDIFEDIAGEYEGCAAEIAQLKAELELTKKQRDQAIDLAVIHSDRIGIFSMARVRDVSNFPELYAHLAGMGK